MATNWKAGVFGSIDFVWDAAYRNFHGLFRILNDGYIVRRVAFFWMIWLTTKAFMWAMSLAEVQKDVSWDHGVLIGAVLTPLSLLHAAIFKFYGETKPTLPELPSINKDTT